MTCEHLEEAIQLCATKLLKNVKMAKDAFHATQTSPGTIRKVILEICLREGPGIDKGRYPKCCQGDCHKVQISWKDLLIAAWEEVVSKKIAEMEPHHAWMSNFVKGLTPKEPQRILETCEGIYLGQVACGDHFQIGAMEALMMAPDDCNDMLAVAGTLHTVYQVLPKGIPQRWSGNPWYRQKKIPQTTSRTMHFVLDHRYAGIRLNEFPESFHSSV